jgi:hypothetical protein
LPSGEEEPIFGGSGIPNSRLYIRFAHKRDKLLGAVLTDPIMTYKETEIVKADILGIVQFDAGEFKPAGSIELFPILESAKGSDDTCEVLEPLQLEIRDFNPEVDS